MSLVEQSKPVSRPTSGESVPDSALGILVIEARSTTPLGPKIVYANEAIARLSGYEIGSLMGSPLGLLYERSDLPGLIEKLPVIATRPNHCFMDRMLMRNGGTKRHCHWTIRATNRENCPGSFFTLTVKPVPPVQNPEGSSADHAQRRRGDSSERDYETVRTESISLAAGGVAHDFKNALQTIKSNLELAALESPAGTKVQTYIDEAHLALGDAEILAHQMLAFTRGVRESKRVIELGDLLKRVSRLCSAGSGIRCRISIPAGLRCVEGDPTQLNQVLHTLVINARQAMPSGGMISITAGNANLVSDNPYSMPPGRYTVASVKDRGCGIPEHQLSRIFDPDFTTKANGSGFGLASCQDIVERHGGAIRVASRVGVGTEFLVFLPSTDAPADPNQTFAAPLRKSGPSLTQPVSGGGRILIVEDQVDVARATRGLLKHLGFESLHSPNGEEAIAVYREHLDSAEPIDAVLLDMTLPGGLTGMDVAREIRRLDPTARIVATSGYFEDGKVDLDDSAGFMGILPKPYSMDTLAEVMESVLSY
ncbi:MAG: ATP-binding protein [Verrucomicrobiales bacterium]